MGGKAVPGGPANQTRLGNVDTARFVMQQHHMTRIAADRFGTRLVLEQLRVLDLTTDRIDLKRQGVASEFDERRGS